jgi:hypothetical protein
MDSKRNELQQNITEKLTIIQSLNIIITSAQSSSEHQVELASQQTSNNLPRFIVNLNKQTEA